MYQSEVFDQFALLDMFFSTDSSQYVLASHELLHVDLVYNFLYRNKTSSLLTDGTLGLSIDSRSEETVVMLLVFFFFF